VVAAFVLYVYMGLGEDKKLVSNDLVWASLRSCVWYAQTLHKQGHEITAYCLPKMVPESTTIYYD